GGGWDEGCAVLPAVGSTNRSTSRIPRDGDPRNLILSKAGWRRFGLWGPESLRASKSSLTRPPCPSKITDIPNWSILPKARIPALPVLRGLEEEHCSSVHAGRGGPSALSCRGFANRGKKVLVGDRSLSPGLSLQGGT